MIIKNYTKYHESWGSDTQESYEQYKLRTIGNRLDEVEGWISEEENKRLKKLQKRKEVPSTVLAVVILGLAIFGVLALTSLIL